jgi:hypothetical protein
MRDLYLIEETSQHYKSKRKIIPPAIRMGIILRLLVKDLLEIRYKVILIIILKNYTINLFVHKMC